MSNEQTPERRARQAEAIRRWQPWEHSTGPKSPEGKRRSAMRGFKGGHRSKLRALAQLMRAAEKRDPREVYAEMLLLINAM